MSSSCLVFADILNIYFHFQSDIMDVNQIFKDLGMLVHEQGEVIGKYIMHLEINFIITSLAY